MMFDELTKEDKIKLNVRLDEIKRYFMPALSPNHYLTYQQFSLHLPLSQNNFVNQNRNIIDIHLRYRWWTREQMSPYKWITIICLTPLIAHHIILLAALPLLYCHMFDYYFEHFFIWRNKDDRIINMRNQFVSKLSKNKNKIRRAGLFKQLKRSFDRTYQKQESLEPPLRFIKFGEFTQYLFHSNHGGKETSSILETSIFHTFQIIKDFLTNGNYITLISTNCSQLISDFVRFRQDDNRTKCLVYTFVRYSNVHAMMSHTSVRQIEQYNLQTNVEHSIRRFIELTAYWRKGETIMSDFSLSKILNFSKYQDIFDPYCFNIKDNTPDLLIYYSIMVVPKLIKIIFRRR